MNARTLLDRIMAVVYRPRPFVRTKTYFGPDRRRRADPDFSGPFRRISDEGGGHGLAQGSEDSLGEAAPDILI